MTEQLEGYEGQSYMNERERTTILALLPDEGSMLEIGTADGATAGWLAERKPHASFLSVDIFPPADAGVSGAIGNYALWRRNAKPNQSLFVGTSHQLARLLPFALFDLTLVDGEHTYEACLSDLRAAGVLTMPRGHICLHDYKRPANGVKAAFETWRLPWQISGVVGSMAILERPEDPEVQSKLKALGYD